MMVTILLFIASAIAIIGALWLLAQHIARHLSFKPIDDPLSADREGDWPFIPTINPPRGD